jgi:hypothetical protein
MFKRLFSIDIRTKQLPPPPPLIFALHAMPVLSRIIEAQGQMWLLDFCG